MTIRLAVVLSLAAFVLPLGLTVEAQKTAQPNNKSVLCNKQNSLDTINQQILSTRTFDNAVQRIAVLIRAADLLWPHQNEKARAAFTEAFDLATQNYKENGDVVGRVSNSQFSMRFPAPDQRT